MTEDTPTHAEELAPAELEQVPAAGTGGILVAMGDGSVRSVSGSDYNTWRANYGITG